MRRVVIRQGPDSVLINLVSIHPSPSPQSIPLANAFLKSYALESPAEIALVDFFISDDAVVCAAKLAATMPAAVGFSMYVWNRKLVCEIAGELRRNQPSIKLFCGGPEVTAAPESVTNTAVFDFIVVGEGEVPFLSICQALTSGAGYSEIPGVLLPDSAVIPPPAPVSNLDDIPSPYLTKTIDINTNPGILWQLSRGCSFTCDFCFDSRGIHGVRYFSLNRLESELQFFAANSVSQIFVLDSTFNLDPKRAKEILRMIRKIAPDIHFHFEIRNEFIDHEMAGLFAEITCSLQIGMQSADRKVLSLVGRSFNKADFTAKIGLLNESGAIFGFDLIYGLPGDTLDGFCRSLDYALSLYPNHLDIFPLAVLPGTRLASGAAALNLKWDATPPYIVKETDDFSATDITAAARLATACDIFYTRGKAVAWFNALAKVLGVKPSALLKSFSDWMITYMGPVAKESDINDDDIWNLQQLFLKELFKEKKVRRFLPLVLDLAHYHYLYSTVLLSPLQQNNDDFQLTGNFNKNCFKLSSSARIAHFNYDIEELLECGEPQFLRMYDHFSKSGSQAVIYRNNGAVCTESLAAPYILLLEQIYAGKNNYTSQTGLDNDEINDFLVFALQEGIIVSVSPDKLNKQGKGLL